MNSSNRIKEGKRLAAIAFRLPSMVIEFPTLPQSLDSQPRQQSRHALAIPPVVLAEAAFQFRVLQADHDRPRQHRKPSQRKKHRHSRTCAPSQHFAEMSEVNRVTDTLANPGGHQSLFAPALDFRTSAKLTRCEAMPRSAIQQDSCRDERRTRNPGEGRVVEQNP